MRHEVFQLICSCHVGQAPIPNASYPAHPIAKITKQCTFCRRQLMTPVIGRPLAGACRASVRTVTNTGITGFNRAGADGGSLRPSPADSGAKTLRHAVGIYAGKSAA